MSPSVSATQLSLLSQPSVPVFFSNNFFAAEVSPSDQSLKHIFFWHLSISHTLQCLCYAHIPRLTSFASSLKVLFFRCEPAKSPKTPCNATIKIESSCLNYCPSFALISNAVLSIFIRKQASTSGFIHFNKTQTTTTQPTRHDDEYDQDMLLFPILVVPLLTREGIYFSATSTFLFIRYLKFEPPNLSSFSLSHIRGLSNQIPIHYPFPFCFLLLFKVSELPKSHIRIHIFQSFQILD